MGAKPFCEDKTMKSKALWVVGMMLSLFGCGQGTPPLNTLGDPSQSLTSTFAIPIANPSTMTAYSSSVDGFSFGINTGGVGVQVMAPADGLVVSADSGSQTIVLFHNDQVYSTIRGVAVSSAALVGQYVIKGTALGSVASGVSSVILSLIVNGAKTCPLSYMTSNARMTIYSLLSPTNTNPCQI
jgi:hypothetical protein